MSEQAPVGNIPSATPSTNSNSPSSVSAANKSEAIDINSILQNHKEKIKISGVERELTYQEMKVLAGKAHAADEKFRAAAEKEKAYHEAESIYKNKDIKKFLEKAGISDPKEAKAYLEELLLPYYEDDVREKENPDAYRAEKAEAKLKQIEDSGREREEEERLRKEYEDKKIETNEYFKKLDRDFEDGFNKLGMKFDAEYHDLAIKVMRDADAQGYDVEVYDALKIVDQKINNRIYSKLSKLPSEELVKLIGKENLKKLREYDTQKAVQANSVLKNRNSAAPRTTANKNNLNFSNSNGVDNRVPRDDYFDSFRKAAR